MDIKLNQVFVANEPLPDAMMAMTCIQGKKKTKLSNLQAAAVLFFCSLGCITSSVSE